jgi:hypothetical protein
MQDTERPEEAPVEDDVQPVVETPETPEQEQPVEEGEETEALEQGEEEAAPTSQAHRRILQEVQRRKALEAELAQARYQQAELVRRMQQPIQDPVERQRRLAEMEPDERYQFLLNERDQALTAHINRLEFQMVQHSDKSNFETYLAANPEFKRYDQDVERIFAEAVQRGQPQSRTVILSWLIGEEVRTKGAKAVAAAKKAGAENIRRQVTRPVSAKSNVAAGDTRKMTAEERLKFNLERGAYNLR